MQSQYLRIAKIDLRGMQYASQRRIMRQLPLVVGNGSGDGGQPQATPLPTGSAAGADRQIRLPHQVRHMPSLDVAGEAIVIASLDNLIPLRMRSADHNIDLHRCNSWEARQRLHCVDRQVGGINATEIDQNPPRQALPHDRVRASHLKLRAQ
ncbi:Uncharacterised protein [Achromobacter xylosoxidans]|nr:Uncharacterised protein [Achromobacter xylosoxidans]CUI91803.1 Uncharacterised protein [Achromobacter xylosoxidans]CUJ63416.1 Uncharacterised protein [Achromobacter xylosoxidans]